MKKLAKINYFVLLSVSSFLISLTTFSQTKCELENAKLSIKQVKSIYKSHPNINMIDLPGKLGFFEKKSKFENDINAIKLAEEMNLKSFNIYNDLSDECSTAGKSSLDNENVISEESKANENVLSNKVPSKINRVKLKSFITTNSISGSCRSCPSDLYLGDQID